MIDDLVTLIELVRKLVQRKSELDKEYFEGFVQPVWEAFLSVHKDYKESFTRYQDMILKSEYDSLELVNKVLDTMKRDSALSSDLRSELGGLIKHIPSAKMKTKETYLSNFIKAIYDYFQKDATGSDAYLQNLRLVILTTMEYHASRPPFVNRNINENLTMIINASVDYIQSHFQEVSDTYHKLRKELLT